MSRYDYRDPGQDGDYCDGLAQAPDDDREPDPPALEVCPACFGHREVNQVRCDACRGRGVLEQREAA
jgi:DnaJ-class molecular chaperone